MSIRDWKIVRVLAGIAMRIWAASGAALLSAFLIYMVYGGFFAFLLLLFAVSGILYHAQDNLLYHPELPANSRIFIPVPSMHGLPYETLHLKTRDAVSLHAFWIRHPGDKGRYVPTIVYFHGNAGNMGHRLQNASGFYHTLQCNVLMVEYRGYGLSTGTASEKGFFADARSILDHLFSRHDLDHGQIIIFGRSLGGAVSIDLAADAVYGSKIMGVIVENTFTSIPDMAVELIHPAVKYLPLLLYRNQYLSVDKIQFISAPILFVSGLADTLVPPRMMTMLHTRCGSTRKQMLQIVGGSHNDTWAVNGYYQGVAQFLKECRETKGPLQTPPVSHNVWPNIEEV
ncbi:protein ABHD13 [Anopheles funestus]|uniref:Protein ABHD13 n=1 Tax=Anopheles funestus TaxID=62324 RepID=A0A182R431_ANOFN|nr:protein ABHD13 [Anopheles funestus]